jgi:hypothetical protein
MFRPIWPSSSVKIRVCGGGTAVTAYVVPLMRTCVVRVRSCSSLPVSFLNVFWVGLVPPLYCDSVAICCLLPVLSRISGCGCRCMRRPFALRLSVASQPTSGPY